MQPDWYKQAWTLDIKNEYWTEDTENEVKFIIKTLGLSGKEKILDLACGYGRHSIALARRGFLVTGVDITKEYVLSARQTAGELSLDVAFIHSDIRDIKFKEEFDVVLNLADGAIGYLEDDNENLKIFDVIASALKPKGKHFMEVGNADHAEKYFPKNDWEIGEKALSLSQYDWDCKSRIMKYAAYDIPYGETAGKPVINMDSAYPIRLYTLAELKDILEKRNMKVISSFSNYYGKPDTGKEMQLMVYSVKR